MKKIYLLSLLVLLIVLLTNCNKSSNSPAPYNDVAPFDEVMFSTCIEDRDDMIRDFQELARAQGLKEIRDSKLESLTEHYTSRAVYVGIFVRDGHPAVLLNDVSGKNRFVLELYNSWFVSPTEYERFRSAALNLIAKYGNKCGVTSFSIQRGKTYSSFDSSSVIRHD